jgi:hypothetical protein
MFTFEFNELAVLIDYVKLPTRRSTHADAASARVRQRRRRLTVIAAKT